MLKLRHIVIAVHICRCVDCGIFYNIAGRKLFSMESTFSSNGISSWTNIVLVAAQNIDYVSDVWSDTSYT